jgi:hypothetical protein
LVHALAHAHPLSPNQQKAVGGKAEKKAKEGGKVDKFMDLKQSMIGAFDGDRREGGKRGDAMCVCRGELGMD